MYLLMVESQHTHRCTHTHTQTNTHSHIHSKLLTALNIAEAYGQFQYIYHRLKCKYRCHKFDAVYSRLQCKNWINGLTKADHRT